MKPLLRQRAARGFTLVEVMVALIVIAIGMLGIAKMQGLALSSTSSSRTRALAAIEASSLASAMQANRAYWSAAGSLPGTITVVTSGGTATPTSTSATLQAAITQANGTLCSGTGSVLSCYCTTGNGAPCTTVALAGSDIFDWGQSLANFLPNATATVTCNSANLPVDCTIQIIATENVVALNTQEAAAASTVSVNYTLNVVP
ncbi:MAG TPA: type IV pilus modification protein PilV [Steroidobacteraceae bacterium]|jgi:type IV pilus assembly protein PilV